MESTPDFGESSLLWRLSDDEFRIVLACFILVGAFFFGIGLELYIGRIFIRYANDDAAVAYYKFVIMCWPMLLIVGLVSFSIFGLPLVVLGLFYGGVPLTLYDVVLATDPRRSWFQRVLNGGKILGSALHHGSFIFICSLVVVGQVTPTRSLLSLGLPLLLMHFSAVLEFVALPIYYVLVLIAEVWFQCEIFASLPFQPTEMKVAFWSMIIAHWLFLGCSIASLLLGKDKEEANIASDGEGIPLVEPKTFVLELKHYLQHASHMPIFKFQAGGTHGTRKEDRSGVMPETFIEGDEV